MSIDDNGDGGSWKHHSLVAVIRDAWHRPTRFHRLELSLLRRLPPFDLLRDIHLLFPALFIHTYIHTYIHPVSSSSFASLASRSLVYFLLKRFKRQRKITRTDICFYFFLSPLCFSSIQNKLITISSFDSSNLTFFHSMEIFPSQIDIF